MHLISTRCAAYLSGLERYVITQITHRPATPLFSTNLTLFLVVFMQYAQEFTLMYTASLWRSISQFSPPSKNWRCELCDIYSWISRLLHICRRFAIMRTCAVLCVCVGKEGNSLPRSFYLSVFGSCHRQAFGNKKGKVKKRGSGKSADTEVS